MKSNFDFGRYVIEHCGNAEYIFDRFIGLKIRVIPFSSFEEWTENPYELRFYVIDGEDTMVFETVDFYGQYDEDEIRDAIKWFLDSVGRPDHVIVPEEDESPFKILEFYNIDTAEQLASLGIPRNLSQEEEVLRVKLFKQRLSLQNKIPLYKLEYIEVPRELDRS